MGKKSSSSGGTTGKKPINRAKASAAGGSSKTKRPAATMTNPSRIRNKLKRSEMYGKYLLEKKARKRQLRLQRSREAEELGSDTTHAKRQPRTLDNTRELEPTRVSPRDEEVRRDETEDEFAPYFGGATRPKILLTTRPRPSRNLFFFIAELQNLMPSLFYYPRQSYTVKQIVRYGRRRNFTHLMVLGEKAGVCNGMIISHLRSSQPRQHHQREEEDEEGEEREAFTSTTTTNNTNITEGGPTAFFKVSNVRLSDRIPNRGTPTTHIPELALNGFATRLGHRVGRLLGSIFPRDAQFRGRRVVTFHNQRDCIFVRHHRYVFEDDGRSRGKNDIKKNGASGKNEEEDDDDDDKKKTTTNAKAKTRARLQELGPRFTLKLRWIQEGTFDSMFGEYEWFHKRKEMDVTRRKFHL